LTHEQTVAPRHISGEVTFYKFPQTLIWVRGGEGMRNGKEMEWKGN